MKKNYQTNAAHAATDELAMPESVTLAMGELAETVKEGLLALAVGAGLQVMQVMMAESVTVVCGSKGRHDVDRSAVRHGSEDGSVTLGGRRVPVRRPRVRSADGTAEVAVPAYDLFASTELLGEMALQRMMAKLSTRRYSAGDTVTVWLWQPSSTGYPTTPAGQVAGRELRLAPKRRRHPTKP